MIKAILKFLGFFKEEKTEIDEALEKFHKRDFEMEKKWFYLSKN